MKFPVDLLADVSQAELEQLAHTYMNNLLFSNPDSPERLTLSDSTQVTIDISSVGFTPLYGSNDKQKILALFSPTDRWTAVAVYLLDRWWAVDDILKTADPARGGAVKVETLGERVVLYILNRVIYRAKEKTSEELPFLCHGGKDYAKILWKNGEAVGFYSVKPSGSLRYPNSTRSYQLPVLDSIFVRKCHRGKGFGLQMLEDFVLSFKESCLGLRYPLSKSMYKVCGKYLGQYPEDADLLWEVESIGGPTERTKIASKIQTVDLSVSKSLSFTEESRVITEEDVTVKEAELPVTARGRSSGSKRKTGEKMTEEKSEKVIRIEDIEAETPREEQVSSQQKTEMHDVSELLLTEGMFSTAPVENGGDVVDTTAKGEGPMSDKAAPVLGSQDELDVTSASTAEEPQVEDVATQHLNNISHDSQITVENVASEIEEAKKEDTALLFISEESLDKTAETLNAVGEGRVLRRRTVTSSPITRRKYTRHNQKVSEELEKEVVEVPEENEVSTTEVVEESAVTAAEEPEETAAIKEDVVAVEKLREEEKQKLEEEQMTNEEQTEKQAEAGVEDAVLSSTDLPDTEGMTLTMENVDEEVTNESETKQKAEEVHICDHPSDEEMDKPFVLQRKGLRDNMKPESTKQSKRHHHTEEADLGPAGPASEEKADEKATEKQEGEHHHLEQDKSVGQTEEKLSSEEVTVVEVGEIPEAEESGADIIHSTEVSVENHKEVQEEENTEPVSAMETEEEEEADDVIQEPAAVTATSGTVIPGEVLGQAAFPVAEELPGKDSGCEIPKTQQATIILVDLKTTYPHLSMEVAEEMPAERECSAEEKELAELRTTEENDVSSCFAVEQTPESGIVVLEEDDRSKQDDTEKYIDVATGAQITEKEDLKGGTASVDGRKGETEEVPFIETRVLRSGRKILKASHQQVEEDNVGEVIAEKKLDEAETGTCEGEGQIEAEANDAVTSAVPVEEKNLSPSTADEELSSEEEEIQISTRALRSGRKTVTATPRHKTTKKNLRKQVGEQEVENNEKEEPGQERVSASVTPQGKPRRICKQIQEEEQKVAEGSKIVEEMGEKEGTLGETIEKTDKEREEEMGVEIGEKVNEEAASDSQEKLEPEIDVKEGKSVAEGAQDVVEKQSEVICKEFAEREAEASGEECDERKDVMVDTADLAREGETLSPKPASNSAICTTSEEEAASADEQQSEEPIPQLCDLQRLTVVLVDLKKPHHNAREETAVVEECVESALEVEEEQSKETMKEEETMREEHVPASPFGIEKTELEKGVEEEGFGGGVEDAVRIQDTEKVGAEETATEDEAKGIDEEEEVKETRALRSKKQAVSDKSREKKDEEEKEETSEIGEDELHTRSMSIPDKQSCASETIHKQLQEKEVDAEEEGEKHTAAEERETEEEEKQAGKQKQKIDKEERSEVKDRTQQIENESEMGLEKVDTGPEEAVIQSEEEQDRITETAADEDTDTPVVQSAAEEKTSEDVSGEGEQSTSTSEVALSTAKDDETSQESRGVANVEEVPVVETRVLRSAGKTVVVTARSKTTKTDEQEKEETREKSTEDGPTVERTVVRKGRRSTAATTPQRKAKRIRTQCETKDNGGEDQTTADEEIQMEKAKAHESEDDSDEKKEETIREGSAVEKEENTEPETAIESVETVAEKESMEEAAISGTCANEQKETLGGECAKEALNTDEGNVTDDEEAPVVETRFLRSAAKAVKATPITQTTKSQQEEKEMEKSSDTETRVLRKGRRSAPATPRYKTKGFRTQCDTDKEGEEEIQVEETETDEKVDTDEMIKEKDGEQLEAQKEEMSEDTEAVAEESVTDQETVEEQQSAVSELCANEQKETPIGERATNIDDGEVHHEEETPVVETRVLRKGRRSAPATLRPKAKRARTQRETEEKGKAETEEDEEGTGQEEKEEKAEEGGTSMESGVKMNKDVEEVESEAGGEPAVGGSEQMKDDLTQEAAVIEKEQNSMAAVDETGSDTVEIEETNSAEETKTTDPEKSTAAAEIGSHTAAAEDEPLVTDQSEVTEEEAPTGTSRALRSKTKASQATPSRRSRRQKDQGVVETQQQVEENPEDEKMQEGHQLTAESVENNALSAEEQAGTDEESPVGQEAGPPAEDFAEEQAKEMDFRVVEATDEEPAGCTTEGTQLELNSTEEKLELNMEAVESEMENILNLASETDEEVENAVLSQEDEEDEQNMSEEEVEPIVIRERFLRGRTVPSLIITPLSKSKRHSTKVQRLEGFLSDEEKSPRSALERRLRKRKCAEVTPTRKSKRRGRALDDD